MTAEHYRSMSEKTRFDLRMAYAMRDNWAAEQELSAYEKWLDRPIRVVKGRKVPKGTTGTVFWIGMRNYAGGWWNWEVRLGFKDEDGNTYFTAEDNCELIERRETA